MLSYKNLKLKFIEIINEKHNSNLINCEDKQVHNVYHWALLSTLNTYYFKFFSQMNGDVTITVHWSAA
jgi:hypothetical protein